MVEDEKTLQESLKIGQAFSSQSKTFGIRKASKDTETGRVPYGSPDQGNGTQTFMKTESKPSPLALTRTIDPQDSSEALLTSLKNVGGSLRSPSGAAGASGANLLIQRISNPAL